MAPGRKLAVITGASSGIGAATAGVLAAAGYELVLGARRADRLQEVAAPLGARALPLDVTDPAQRRAFAAAVPRADVLVGNAGAALGLDRIEQADEGRWEEMFQTNVLGVLRTTRAFLPTSSPRAAVTSSVVGSTAGFETYPGGAGYTASKHAVRALVRTLRLELLGGPVRITEVNPGMAETEFSEVASPAIGSARRQVYEGMEPLTAGDVAECIRWVSPGRRVNVDEIVVRPRIRRLPPGVPPRRGGGRCPCVADAPPSSPPSVSPPPPWCSPAATSSCPSAPRGSAVS